MFLVVAEELNFTRAAVRLAIAQPPLSQHIRRLETDLGVQLFSRTSRKVELTAAGHQLLKGARELLAKRAEVINLVRRAAGGETGALRLSVGTTSAFGIVAEVLRAYRQRFPAVAVRLDEHGTEAAISALVAGEVDVAFLRGPITSERVAFQRLLLERLELVLASDHPLASEVTIDLAAMSNEPMILFPRATAPMLHDVITSLCIAAGFSPNIAQEGTSWASVVGLVGAGVGFTIAPASAALIRSRDVLFKPISGMRGEAELVLAYRVESVPPVGEHFIALAAEVCATPLTERGSQGLRSPSG